MAAATTTPPRSTRKVKRARAALAIEVPTGVGQLSTAATRKIKDQEPRKLERQKWQEEAYGHVDFIGEVGYVTGQIADVVARADIKIVERDLETGDVIVPKKNDEGDDIIEGDRAVAEKALLALRGPAGDHKAIIRSIAEADFIAGEGHLVGTPLDKIPPGKGIDTKTDRKGQIAWEFLSIMEVVEDRQSGKKARRRHAIQSGQHGGTGDSKVEELDEDTYISRYHRRDPRHSGDATSSMRRVAAACREVVLLTQLIEATIKSHIPAGILLVADELSLPAGTEDESVDDDEEVDPLLEVLTEHLSAPIEDRQSAASLVPLLLNAPAEVLDKALKLVKLDAERMDPERIINLRENALGRIATGVDVPPETMTGMGSLNHWTGATVSKDFIEKHVIPAGDRIVQFLTIAYLRRFLMIAEGWDEARAERFEFEFDASSLLSRSDAAASADSLWKDRVLSDDARLRAHGFDPDKDKPKDEERFRRYVEAIALAASVTNKPFLAALGLTKDVLVEMGMDPDAADALLQPSAIVAEDGEGPDEDPAEAGEEGANEDAIAQEEADTAPGGTETPVTTGPEELARIQERVRVAASERLKATVERAAGLVIQRIPRDSLDTKDRVRALAKLEVLPAIPASDWRKMAVDPSKVVARPWVQFQGLTVTWLRSYFEDTLRMSHLNADDAAHRVASEVVAKLDELYLAAYQRPLRQLPDGLYFPDGIVEESVARHLELVTA
jgi:hypothetical protein